MDALRRELDDAEDYLSQKRRLTKEEAERYRKSFSIELASDGTFAFKRDMDKIEELSKNFGFFRALSNTSLDSAQVLKKYRRKDIIEKSFDDIKNYMSMKRSRTHTTATTDGKIFCAFISLAIMSDIEARPRKLMDKKSLSKAGVIRETDKISVGASNNVPILLNPLAKTQRMIINELGLDETDLKAYIGCL
jgi:transposase